MKNIITRADDFGSSKGANDAILEAVQAGFIRNVSLMACGAFIEEGAARLKDADNVCFGIHFTMNSEWDRIKFAPLAPADEIPLLLDSSGEFYSSPEELMEALGETCRKESNPKLLEQIRREWRLQLARLRELGFLITYGDTHMFPERTVPGLKESMREWMREEGLLDHRCFYHPLPHLDAQAKVPGLWEITARGLEEGQYFYLAHPAIPSEDMYLTGNRHAAAADVVKAREQDYRFVTGERTLKICEEAGIRTIRYDEAVRGDYDSVEEWLGNRMDYRAFPIDDGTFRIEDPFGDYLYLVLGTERAALIDTGIGWLKLSDFVRTLTELPVSVLHTHGHLDHIGGDGGFRDIYLHPADAEVFAEHRGAGYRGKIRVLAEALGVNCTEDVLEQMIHLPEFSVTESLKEGDAISLGGRSLKVIETPGHTGGSVCFLDEARGQLFSGDTVCHLGVMLSFPCSASVETFAASIRKLKSIPGIREIYPGHHLAPVDTGYFDQYLACAECVLEHPESGEKENSPFGGFYRLCYGDVSLTYLPR